MTTKQQLKRTRDQLNFMYLVAGGIFILWIVTLVAGLQTAYYLLDRL